MSNAGGRGPEEIKCRGVKCKPGVSFINFKWGVGDELVLFTAPKPNTSKQTVQPKGSFQLKDSRPSEVCVMRWNCLLQETRKLVDELRVIFLKIQNHHKTCASDAAFRSELAKAGKNIRAILFLQTQAIKNAIDTGSYLDDPIFLAENQPMNSQDITLELNQLRTSVGNTLTDLLGKEEGVEALLLNLRARGIQHVIAQGSVGDPFPFMVATICIRLHLQAHLVLRAKPGADHPTSTPLSEVIVLSPAQYKLRNQQLLKLQASLPDAEVIQDMGRAANAYYDAFDLCRTMYCVWHLCEICYWPTLSPTAYGLAVVTTSLVEWHQEHGGYEFPPDTDLEDVNTFWDTICKTLVQGRTKNVLDLLRSRIANPQIGNSAKVLESLVAEMPLLQHGDALAEFAVKWKTWHTKCGSSRMQFNPVTGPGKAIAILCGDEEILRLYSKNWLDLFVSLLLYSRPTSHMSELPHLLGHCMNVCAASTAYDSLLRSVVFRDVYQTLTLALEHYPPWFGAHLGDFLHHTTHLDPSPSEYPVLSNEPQPYLPRTGQLFLCCAESTERLLLAYGSSLIGQSGLWQVSVDYFSQCGIFSSSFTQETLDRQAIESDLKADKLLQLAITPYQIKKISRVHAMNQHNKGRYAACLATLLRTEDTERLAAEVEWILSHIETVENSLLAIANTVSAFDSVRLDAAVVKSHTLEPRLVFLDKYYQLVVARKTGNPTLQAKLLAQLLTNRIAPRKFWSALLIECVPLLESDHAPPLFNTQDTCLLIGCVEDLLIDYFSFVEESGISITEAEFEAVRLALTRNLARVICN